MAGTMPRREPGELEQAVLAALWAHGRPMTGPEVHAELGPAGQNLAYKTVLTVLTRLHGKGTLQRHRVGRAHAYTPRADAADHAAAQMNAVLARGGDHVAVLERFVSRLAPDDEAALRALLTERD